MLAVYLGGGFMKQAVVECLLKMMIAEVGLGLQAT
jgi:hypothetical protein